MNAEPRRRRLRSGPSMVDVATLAGVSPITVSRVANGSPSVLEETRQRVLAAMDQVGYRPNTAARALATGRFGAIGIIGFTLTTYGNTRTIAATANAAANKGYIVTLLTTAPREGDIRGAYARLREHAVDGVIVLADEELLDAHGYTFPPGVPVVLASGGASQYHGVDSDQFSGGRQATEFLLSLGHRNVWHVSGPTTFFSANARRDGWHAALRDAGIRPPRVLVGDWSGRSGYLHGQRLAADPKVTAVFVANDQMALGVTRALHEAGRDVPDEVSVVGFDDMEDSDSFWPPLTTIRQRFDLVGRICVDTLLHEMRGEPIEGVRRHLVPTELVIRQSAAPPQHGAALRPGGAPEDAPAILAGMTTPSQPADDHSGRGDGRKGARRFGWQDMFVGPDADPRGIGGIFVHHGDERTVLAGYLHDYRLTLELKCAGLDAQAMARRSVEPSDLSLLGLVRHLSDAERGWFRRVMAGEDAPARYRAGAGDDHDRAFSDAVADPAAVALAWDHWRDEVAFAERFVDEATDLNLTRSYVGRGGRRGEVSLREVLVHMIEEYARHIGHADLLRERIDGRVGL